MGVVVVAGAWHSDCLEKGTERQQIRATFMMPKCGSTRHKRMCHSLGVCLVCVCGVFECIYVGVGVVCVCVSACHKTNANPWVIKSCVHVVVVIVLCCHIVADTLRGSSNNNNVN